MLSPTGCQNTLRLAPPLVQARRGLCLAGWAGCPSTALAPSCQSVERILPLCPSYPLQWASRLHLASENLFCQSSGGFLGYLGRCGWNLSDQQEAVANGNAFIRVTREPASSICSLLYEDKVSSLQPRRELSSEISNACPLILDFWLPEL